MLNRRPETVQEYEEQCAELIKKSINQNSQKIQSSIFARKQARMFDTSKIPTRKDTRTLLDF